MEGTYILYLQIFSLSLARQKRYFCLFASLCKLISHTRVCYCSVNTKQQYLFAWFAPKQFIGTIICPPCVSVKMAVTATALHQWWKRDLIPPFNTMCFGTYPKQDIWINTQCVTRQEVLNGLNVSLQGIQISTELFSVGRKYYTI